MADIVIIILSGISGVGKSCLQRALIKFYPDLMAGRPVLCTSRPPRKNEIHGHNYYFLPAGLIASLPKRHFVVAKVRSDWQALDLVMLDDIVREHKIVFIELYHTFAIALQKALAKRKGVSVRSIFLTPVKPGARATKIKAVVLKSLKNRGADTITKCRERAKSAVAEIGSSGKYDYIILNQATEDDVDEWGEFGMKDGKPGTCPIGTMSDLGLKAAWLVQTVANIMHGKMPIDRRLLAYKKK